MTEAQKHDDAIRFGESARKLLAEYSAKIQNSYTAITELNKLFSRLQADLHTVTRDRRPQTEQSLEEAQRAKHSLSTQFHLLEPAYTQLARRISQRLEHTEMDDIVRMELEIRLAEFESLLQVFRLAL